MKTERILLSSRALKEIAEMIPPETYFPAKCAEAARFVVSDLYAFLVGCSLDRGTKAEIIWTIPYAMKIRLGHLNPRRIHSMTVGELYELFDSLEYRPRVGPGIANMTILLIEKAFRYRFTDLDRKKMDIKPDVHTKRVLFRIGASKDETDQSAIDAARIMNPEFPGELDGPLWWVGRNWCHSASPECNNCPLSENCVMHKAE